MFRQSSILVVFCVIIGSLAKPPPTFLEYKDSLGQYSFGYSAPGSARSEVRSIDGSTRGSYSYVDVFGNIQSAQYTADGENGFQITATNLPQAPRPVEDTAEVAAAKLDHFKALEAASKLAAENSELNQQPSDIEAAKSANIDDIKKAERSEEESVIQAQVISAMSPESVMRSSPEESQDMEPNGLNKDSIKNSSVGSQAEMAKMLTEPSPDGLSVINDSQRISVEVPSHSDVPVVTTSFVIPGSLNLRTRIQLDQSSAANGRITPQTSSPDAGQPSQSQDVNSNPSISTPAGTRMTPMVSSGPAENSGGISSLSSASTKAMENVNQLQEHSTPFAPSAISPLNPHGFLYGIGINPIYRHYTPYHYIPYTIL